MKLLPLLSVAFALVAAGASPLPPQDPDASGPAVHTYRQVDGQALKAYVFAPEHRGQDQAASAVLLFHGGGWSVGSPEWTFGAARRFAAHGVVAIPVEYRLSEGETTPIDVLADVCAAFRWARSHSAELGIDPDRVAGYGVSAGGHLVTSAATVGCPQEGTSAARSEPDALLLWSPALDMTRDGWFERKLQGRATAEAYSPLAHVRASTPPTSIVQGDADTLTPLSGAERFCERLAGLGGTCELNVYGGVGHLLTRNLGQQERDFDPDPEAVAGGVEAHLRFLREQGFIAGGESLRRTLDARVPAWLEEHGVPSAAVAYVRDGAVAFTAVYGEQSPGVPATERTLYNAASLTKPVTAEVVLRLVSQGRIALDEPMSAHWVDPDLADDSRHELLTPRIALTHRTGFANWRRQTDGVLRFAWEPGAQTGYSGEGFDYLVRFVERKLGAPFEEIAKGVLFGPAGMHDAAYTERDGFEGRLAWPFLPSGDYPDGAYREPWVPASLTGADGLRTTIGDYARFLVHVMSGEGVSDAVAAERVLLSYDQVAEQCPEGEINGIPCPERAGFGLSWFLFGYEGETIVHHSGADPGVQTLAFYVPERGLGVVVLTNGEHGHHVIHEIAGALYDHDDWLTMMRPSGD